MDKPNDKKTSDVKVEIPIGGSLGLLALGHKGLFAWRQAKLQYSKELKTKENHEKKG